MSTLKPSDEINPKIQAVVYGFIHEFEHENDDKIMIPDVVIFTCLAFYYMGDLFTDYASNRVSISKTGSICTNISNGYRTSLYGSYNFVVPTTSTYRWKFKCITIRYAYDFAIGIDDANNRRYYERFYPRKASYAFLGNGKGYNDRNDIETSWSSTLGMWRNGDVIEMIYNGTDGSLRIMRNNE